MRRLAAVVAAALAATACSASPPSPKPGPGPLDRFTTQRLAWGACTPYGQNDFEKQTYADNALECASLTVPLDYSKPTGETVTVGLLRHRATDAAKRVGALVVDPGGPGGSGMMAAASLVQPAGELAKEFDLVGFDPRGVHASRPRITCRSDADQDADRASDIESDNSPAGVAKQLAEAKDYGAACVGHTGAEFLEHVGTREVVQDLDVLRAALGEPKLTYLGYSYGTQIGSAYAEAYPTRVRAMVLDGAIDPALDLPRALITQTVGFQDAFTEFAKWCAPRPGCPLQGDPTAAFQRLARPLVAKPVPARGARKLSFEDAITGTSAALYSRQRWDYLAAGLSQLEHDQGGNLLDLADSYYERDRQGHYGGEIDAYFAVRCVDFARVTDRAAIDAAHRQMLAGAPFLAGGTPDTSELDICSNWPVPPTSRAHRPAAPRGLPKVLVVSTTHDPATPYQQGVDLAKDLGAALLTFEGTQHTAFLSGSACVDKAVGDYLRTGIAAGTRCT
ncbi:alpha/beta hydrolase [Amycolatopsis saalfeldensis]|uniref:Alpha/beta hydrolase fold n=1 Tax=Amycolatopsis saalfeldensis TaxID=394193 RepID=A0A1H8YQM1_9PSEU|nr:alpha/beta hydrolase [Amycolatopsis saalfeldensis]SEP54480.1 alpha/beta hydrolase fold [Amycolatopsis saalfeldensis]